MAFTLLRIWPFGELGFFITLLNNNSQFHKQRRNIINIRTERKALTIGLILFLFSGVTYAQQNTQQTVSKTHGENFGKILVQTYGGRFQPLHSLAYDVLHKISRKIIEL